MKKNACFILLPGFASDSLALLPIQRQLKRAGYAAVAANFWGEQAVDDFSTLTIARCLTGVDELVASMHEHYDLVIGLGFSLGGALLIEHAKIKNGLDYIISIGTPFQLKNRFLIKLGIAAIPLVYPLWKRLAQSRKNKLPPIGAAKMAVDYFSGDFLKSFEKVTTPLLFIHSKKDTVTEFRAVPAALRYFSNTKRELEVHEEGDHVLNYNSETIVTAVERLLERENFK